MRKFNESRKVYAADGWAGAWGGGVERQNFQPFVKRRPERFFFASEGFFIARSWTAATSVIAGCIFCIKSLRDHTWGPGIYISCRWSSWRLKYGTIYYTEENTHGPPPPLLWQDKLQIFAVRDKTTWAINCEKCKDFFYRLAPQFSKAMTTLFWFLQAAFIVTIQYRLVVCCEEDIVAINCVIALTVIFALTVKCHLTSKQTKEHL